MTRVLRIGALAIVLLACSNGAERVSSTTTATDDTSVDPTRAEAVLEGYRAGWDAFVAAAAVPDPAATALTETMSGRALADSVAYLRQIQQFGEVLDGTVDLAPVVQSVDGDEAVVVDCVIDSMYRHPAGVSTTSVTVDPKHYQYEVHLVLDDGTWKQELLVSPAPCSR